MTEKTSSSEIWGKIRALSHRQTPRAITLISNNTLHTNPTTTSNILGQHFAKQSNGKYDNPIFSAHQATQDAHPPHFERDSKQWYNQNFTIDKLHRALHSSSSKSPGADTIPFSFLHHFPSQQLKSLLKFYNYIYANGFPHQWREAIIVPILKPGKPATSASSYRPIALTNCLCKIMEKMINYRLQAQLERCAFFSPYHSGFRAGHSTVDALFRLETEARESLLINNSCAAIFLDITRAFDTVWHGGILQKLKSMGIGGNLACFVRDFLSLRSLRTRVGGHISNSYPIYSGVPQGSVLSPTLFCIMINDIFARVNPPVQCSLYADDGAIWVSQPTQTEAIRILQGALQTIEEWSQRWGLAISAEKTTAIMFTRSRRTPDQQLQLNGTNLQFVSQVRFLGVIFDQKLTWGPHIAGLASRCQADLRLLQVIAARRWGADATTLRRLYIALIRSKLDYASFLLTPAAATHLLKLDRIQYEAAQIILGSLRCTPSAKLEAEADMMPLELRQQQTLLTYCSRILTILRLPARSKILNYYPFALYEHLT